MYLNLYINTILSNKIKSIKTIKYVFTLKFYTLHNIIIIYNFKRHVHYTLLIVFMYFSVFILQRLN